MTDVWPAPMASVPVDATVALPGSKSITNRALVLAALAEGPSTIRAPLRARDSQLMVGGLRALGVAVDDAGADWTVMPAALAKASVDVGNSGTVLRFLPALAGLATGPVAFDGDPRARDRPMRPMLQALQALGAKLEGAGGLPFTVYGAGRVAGGEVTLDASASSQFVSGLLLSGARYDHGVVVGHAGPPLPSLPHIAMTVAMLRAAGVAVDDSTPSSWQVAAGRVQPVDVEVEPDLSNAAPFLAAALVTGGRVTIAGWPAETTQPGAALPELLAAMGAEVRLTTCDLTLTGSGNVHGLDADLREVGELAPVLAAVAALADSPSSLRGLAHLRGHETDRLAALAKELGSLGARVAQTDDGLVITPAPLHGGVFATYDDHRLATAAAVLGLVVPGVQVVDVATTAKTLPGFVARWDAMLGRAS